MSRREPTVAARRSGAQLVVDCPFCPAVHWHGGEPGPRLSHCRNQPKQPYTLVEVPAPLQVPANARRTLRRRPGSAPAGSPPVEAPVGGWRGREGPVLPARRTRDGYELVIACPTGGWHWHGRCIAPHTGLHALDADVCDCPTGAGDGPREAHCREAGRYVLVEIEASTPAALGACLAAALGVDGPLDTFEAHHTALQEASPAQLDEALDYLSPGRGARRALAVTKGAKL